MSDLDVLVLAAGKSTRITEVSKGLPKPLLPVCGEPILVRNLRWLAGQGVKSAWMNLHYRPDAVREAVESGIDSRISIRFSWEPDILGTGGAVAKLRDEWQSTVLVVYGDNLLSFDLQAMIAAHQAWQASFTMAVFDPSVNAHSGIAGSSLQVSPDGRVVGFAEIRSGAPSEKALVNAGVYLIEPSLIRRIPDGISDFGSQLIPDWIAAGVDIRAHTIDGYCLGLDTPTAFRTAIELIETQRVQLL